MNKNYKKLPYINTKEFRMITPYKQLDKAKLDHRKTCKVLYIIHKGKDNTNNIPHTHNKSKKNYYEPKAIANVFNDYFTLIGPLIS